MRFNFKFAHIVKHSIKDYFKYENEYKAIIIDNLLMQIQSHHQG